MRVMRNRLCTFYDNSVADESHVVGYHGESLTRDLFKNPIQQMIGDHSICDPIAISRSASSISVLLLQARHPISLDETKPRDNDSHSKSCRWTRKRQAISDAERISAGLTIKACCGFGCEIRVHLIPFRSWTDQWKPTRSRDIRDINS